MQENSTENKIIASLIDAGILTPEKAKMVERVKAKLSSETTIISILKDLNYEESDTLLVVVRLADMVCNKVEANNPQEDLTFIMGSRETDILGIKETVIALLEIALEDAGLAKALSPI